MNKPSEIQFEERSELVVALFRMAFLVSLLFARVVAAEGREGVWFWSDLIVALASFYNLAILICYWREVHFRHERELTVGVDLLLVTVCVAGTGGTASPLFPLYYMVVIVGSYWFELPGVLLTATGASAMYLLVAIFDGGAPGEPLQRFIMAVFGSVPFLYLIALIVGYMSRAIRAEQERTARHEQELAMARRIQQGLLAPSLPPTPGYEIAYRIEPASEIGGDYFDVLSLGSGRVGICVADVAGRGISAAQHLSLFKFVMHVAAPQVRSPARVAKRVNELLMPHLQPDMFVAMFYAVLDLRSGRLTYVNAGHTPPLLCDADASSCEELTTGGTVLGALRKARYRSRTRILRPGQMLVLYTDGVESSRDGTGKPFGADRVRESIRALADAPPRRMADLIVQTVEAFARAEGEDDLTVAVVRRVAPHKPDNADVA